MTLQVNRLYVLPTPETMAYLSKVVSGAPLDINKDTWHVEVMTSTQEIEPDPERVYVAKPTLVRVWYDSALQRSSLILSLESPALQLRGEELREQGIQREFYDYYNPHMTILQNMPPLSTHYRRFVVQTANALCGRGLLLKFGNELVVREKMYSLPDMDYNQSMYAMKAQGM